MSNSRETMFTKGRRWVLYHIYWRLLRRIYPNKIMQFRLPDGSVFRYPVEGVIAGALIAGRFEPSEIRFMQAIVRPGDTVLDVGANGGVFSVMGARQIGPNGHIYAFEPGQRELALLRENIAVNGLANVTVVDKAVSDREGSARFAVSRDGAMNSLFQTEHPMQEVIAWDEVATTTIDAFVEQQHLSRVDVIKIDVEGAERLVFNGMQKLLETQQEVVVLFEAVDANASSFGYTTWTFLSELLARGLRVYYLSDGGELVAVTQFSERFGQQIYNFVALNFAPEISTRLSQVRLQSSAKPKASVEVSGG